MNEPPIGTEWFRLFYPKICAALNYDQALDEASRDLLSGLLKQRKTDPEILRNLIRGRDAVLFGAGPSLDYDLNGLENWLNNTDPLIVAADGAADALYRSGLNPSIIISDLDSCSLQSLEKNSREAFVFVHAHGDNQALIRNIVPELGENIYGTTQVSSVANVTNFGGLTDGDRACYVVSEFGPSGLIIAGMDFGSNEGEYSKNKYVSGTSSLRPTKLAFGKESLEFLIQSKPEIKFVNVTKFGEEIRGAPKRDYAKIT